MRHWAIALVVTFLCGCAAQPGPTRTDAIGDFIKVAELEEQDTVRAPGNFHHTYLTERYVILETRKEKVLVQFRRRCRALNETLVVPDVRDGNILRARFDTIRGCRIDQMFSIDEGQAQELENIGEAPGEDT
jgi:hypothetical protein